MPNNIEKLNNSTWAKNKHADNDPDDVVETEIGDVMQAEFMPQIKIKKWGNEANFSVRLVDDEVEATETEEAANEIKYKKPKKEVVFKETTDGFDMVVVFKEKPASNVVQYTINTKGLVFQHQPALTQEEIDAGVNRPDNVVDSYAVYHSTKKDHIQGQTNYKTGKAFHWYRAEAVDANGNKTWCTRVVDADAGTAETTIPQDFLDNAVYPVKLTV